MYELSLRDVCTWFSANSTQDCRNKYHRGLTSVMVCICVCIGYMYVVICIYLVSLVL